jgi:hypothetical protein
VYCSDDGYAQTAARQLEAFGINATDNSLAGKATVLRVGEAIDAVQSGIRSSQASTPLESSGYLVCSIVQLGLHRRLKLAPAPWCCSDTGSMRRRGSLQHVARLGRVGVAHTFPNF